MNYEHTKMSVVEVYCMKHLMPYKSRVESNQIVNHSATQSRYQPQFPANQPMTSPVNHQFVIATTQSTNQPFKETNLPTNNKFT